MYKNKQLLQTHTKKTFIYRFCKIDLLWVLCIHLLRNTYIVFEIFAFCVYDLFIFGGKSTESL